MPLAKWRTSCRGVAVSSDGWSVTGASYVGGFPGGDPQNTGGPVAADLSGSQTYFYFTNSGAGVVTYTANLSDGSSVSATTSYGVVRPTGNAIVGTPGTASVIQLTSLPLEPPVPLALTYGNTTDPNPADTGMVFTAQFTEPSAYQGGSIEWVQLVNSGVVNVVNQNANSTETCSGLDTKYPNATESPTNDSPYQAVVVGVGNLSVAVSNSFTMWLMWMPPPGPAPSIFVPLAQLRWSWSAGANSSDGGNTFRLVSPVPAGNVTSADTSVYPAWTQNAKGTGGCAVTTN